jgi:hypothetical protein
MVERGCPLLNASLFTLKFLIVIKKQSCEKVKLYCIERGVEEGIAPFIYGIISVRFKF